MSKTVKILGATILFVLMLMVLLYFLFSRLGLKNDLEKVFKSNNIQLKSLDCSMLGAGSQRSRVGVCIGDLVQSDIDSAVKNLKLDDISEGLFLSPEEIIKSSTKEEFEKKQNLYDKLQNNENFMSYQSFVMGKVVGSCEENLDFQNSSSVKLFISKSKFQIGNDGTFRYMLLYFNQETGKTCIQVEYAYG